MTDTPLCRLADLSDSEGFVAIIDGAEVAIFNTGEGVFAITNRCPHGAASLSEGFLEGCTIECPLHGAVFDLRTGEPITGPVYDPVLTYPVRISGDEVVLDR